MTSIFHRLLPAMVLGEARMKILDTYHNMKNVLLFLSFRNQSSDGSSNRGEHLSTTTKASTINHTHRGPALHALQQLLDTSPLQYLDWRLTTFLCFPGKQSHLQDLSPK